MVAPASLYIVVNLRYLDDSSFFIFNILRNFTDQKIHWLTERHLMILLGKKNTFKGTNSTWCSVIESFTNVHTDTI